MIPSLLVGACDRNLDVASLRPKVGKHDWSLNLASRMPRVGDLSLDVATRQTRVEAPVRNLDVVSQKPRVGAHDHPESLN